ncbi:MAG: PhnD/SsuA/transferrin family substrate-binding protein, partial [Deltaproteobacteria bacterium]|nr:PhnD/SsuA/transferrin family substrate-binding protein [Deltaproteobacteria bacterium]
VYAVRDGQADAGCVRTSTLERMQEEGLINLAEFRVIPNYLQAKHMFAVHHLPNSTRAYPEWPLAKLNHVDDILVRQVTQTLVEMPSDSSASKQSHSYGWSYPLNYQPVHDCLRELKVGPYLDYGKFSSLDVLKKYWPHITLAITIFLLFLALSIRFKKLNIELEKAIKMRDFELTLRKKVEIEREKLISELQESADKIKFFAYSVSHDLKNPAIALQGITGLMLKKYDKVLDAKGLLYCERIAKAAAQIVALVEQTNTYMSTKEQPLALETVNTQHLFSAIKQEYSSQLRKRGIKWLASGSEITVRADRLSLFRVFRNFIDNALKYGGDSLSKIEIKYNGAGETHIFSVTNDGAGLAPDDCQKIFTPFKRIKAVPDVEGSGLGLAIIKEIAKLHKGEAWVDSDGRSWVTFYFSIAKNL